MKKKASSQDFDIKPYPSDSLNRSDGNVSKIETHESENIDDAFSFGQSAGLKDDLDVDNNYVGKRIV